MIMERSSVSDFLDDFLAHGSEWAYVHRRGYRTERWTYRQVAESAFQLAREFESRGIAKGDRVLIRQEEGVVDMVECVCVCVCVHHPFFEKEFFLRGWSGFLTFITFFSADVVSFELVVVVHHPGGGGGGGGRRRCCRW